MSEVNESVLNVTVILIFVSGAVQGSCHPINISDD
jgi:hypothetical protein